MKIAHSLLGLCLALSSSAPAWAGDLVLQCIDSIDDTQPVLADVGLVNGRATVTFQGVTADDLQDVFKNYSVVVIPNERGDYEMEIILNFKSGLQLTSQVFGNVKPLEWFKIQGASAALSGVDDEEVASCAILD